MGCSHLTTFINSSLYILLQHYTLTLKFTPVEDNSIIKRSEYKISENSFLNISYQHKVYSVEMKTSQPSSVKSKLSKCVNFLKEVQAGISSLCSLRIRSWPPQRKRKRCLHVCVREDLPDTAGGTLDRM